MFTDSYAPAEWSFSTYMRPVAAVPAATDGWEDTGSGANHHSIEEPLWANFISDNTFTASSGATAAAWANGVTATTGGTTYDFTDSNSVLLGTFTVYFVLGACDATTAYDYSATDGQTIYSITESVANTASIDFDIDGIAMINWSGFGKIITEVNALDLTAVTKITEGIDSTTNFIRNRLTSLAVTNADTDNFASSYSLVLTGGNITFENNITYITPETLCTVNQPLGHVTGTRSVGGNFTAYLNADGVSTADLFEDIIEATNVVTNAFGLTFNIGGAGTPRVEVTMTQCHLEVPAHSMDDTVSVDTTFSALPTSMDATDEATIKYIAA